jgi:SAM-dependent methyltransferase
MVDYEKGGKQKDSYSPEEVIGRNCPLCKSASYIEIYKERGAIGIVKCRNCGLIYTNPMAKEAEKNYWGDEKRYYEEARLIFEYGFSHHRDSNYSEDLKLIERIKPSGNFLDIGTNMGFFLRHTRGRKWNAVGIEPSPALSEMARKYFGLNVKTTYLDKAGFNEEYFDVVTMTDVFEHVQEPGKILLDIKKSA